MTPPSAPSAPSARPVRPLKIEPRKMRWRTRAAAPQPEGVTIERKHRCRVRFFPYRQRNRKTMQAAADGAPYRRPPVKPKRSALRGDRPPPPTAGARQPSRPFSRFDPCVLVAVGSSSAAHGMSATSKGRAPHPDTRMPSPEAPAQAKGAARAALRRVHGPRHKTTRRVRASRGAIWW